MNRTFTRITALVLCVSFLSTPLARAKAPTGFEKGATAAELQERYDDGKVRILIAPGHEPLFGGAEYQGIYEREIVLEIAQELRAYLDANPRYEVITTRTNTAWNKALGRYFTKEADEIEDFVGDQKRLTKRLVRRGSFEKRGEGDQVAHATAPDDVALRLYGINKWANENDIDLVLNLHINDAPDHGPTEPSAYSGFAVYIPDKEYGNHAASEEVGEAIANRLNALTATSTLPGESAGVVEDQELIAIGAYGTLNVPSVLIEYGYITEPRFVLTPLRKTVTEDLAYQTYLALQDFFGDPVASPRAVAALPYLWPAATTTATTTGSTTTPALPPITAATPVAGTSCAAFTATLTFDTETKSEDVSRLQRILAKDPAIYPEALVTGYFGPATLRAVKRFQEKQGIVSSGSAATTGYGAVGPRTAAALLKLCAQ